MARPRLKHLIPQAGTELLSLLDASRGLLLPPLRSEIFGPLRLAAHGRSLGATHRAATPSWRTVTFFPRLRSNIRVLREAYRFISAQARSGHEIGPADEWLLDNFHLIEAQFEAVHEGLPRNYYRALPVLLDEPLASLPRVYGIAWAFVAHSDGAFDEELLLHFLAAYQESCELTLGEIWALPTTLRVVLIENLRRLAERLATHKAAREVANLCCDRIDACHPAPLDELLGAMTRRGVAAVFLAQLALRLHEHGEGPASPLRAWLHEALPDPSAALAQHNADLTADNLSVGNAVTSLRLIGEVDWTQLVPRASRLMQVMLGSPLFEAEHTRTRDHTLHAIERFARRGRRSEVDVAQALLGLMASSGASAPDEAAARQLGATHWLNGDGRADLAQALGLPAGSAPAWHRARRHLVLPLYLGAVALGTLTALGWLLHGGRGPADLTWWSLLTAGLLVLPASEAAVALVNRLVSESVPPRQLPRLALAGGIPPDHRVMVVIPALLTSPVSIRTLVHQLHLHHLANPEPCAQFALLTDWADADAEQVPGDQDLLADALAQIEALERLCRTGPPGAPTAAPAGLDAPRFLLLHRARRFSATEQRWIGWERKRGKLEQLVAQLATGQAGAFLDLGRASRTVAGVRYLVTLDSDTRLPPGRLRELVGVAAHPHNTPWLDARQRRMATGFAILQPHVAAPLPAPGERTPFHWLFSGPCGTDPYSSATSQLYQDLFDEGSFAGKGLLHVQAVHALLGSRLPEDRVLSHDLLEGALARCAALSDIAVIEAPPSHADVAASRRHRWTRGDWQLLPFLLQPRRWPLGAVNRWKVLDNLRRSLVPPAALAGLCLTLAGAGLSPWRTLLLVLLALGAGPLMGALAGSTPSRRQVARRPFCHQVATDWLRALGATLWTFALLLHDALDAADAIVRALYRIFVSHRHLLQWTTAEAAQAAAADASAMSLRGTLRRHAREPVAAATLLAALWALDTPLQGLSLTLCLLWGAAPLWTWWASRPSADLMAWPRAALALPTRAASSVEQRLLATLARDTWRYFERCVGAQDHHLPPDNLQTAPHPILAHRTSPTNIGLYLLSTACARRFGWIDTADLLARLEATLGTLRQLQRHRGHFLNWYDTRSLAPLLPMYVSTVDSGNLSGHLLAVAQACRELAQATTRPAEAERLLALAEAFEPLAWEADFSFLYNRRRHLLHIGHRVADGLPDPACYDLLASESRLASLLAIAKGDVPLRHWAALGRPACAAGSTAGLRSWSGSMFEYFMPGLVLDEPEGSVLHEACRAALQEQVAWAQAHGLPWGVSESAYAANDHTLAYQYAPQGVPSLALRRTPPDEWVVAPYATVLAAGLAPRLACRNLAALEALGARSSYGFIEALDFTPARQTSAGGPTRVQTFMAHHQGMSIVALANLLLGGTARRWGMANPHLQAVATLLHERAPREVPVIVEPLPTPPAPQRPGPVPGWVRELWPDAEALPPTQLLSNGHYSVTLRPNGAGWSRWGVVGVTRSRDDALRDALGSFLYLRHQRHGPVVSLTSHPAPDDSATYGCVFHADRVCFDARWPHLLARTTVWVSPEDDIELRRVELHNLGDAAIEIELISAFEVSLSQPQADVAHPAFANLFVSARWQAPQQALLFERTPRLPSEPALQMAHFLAETDPLLLELQIQTDRQLWAGRNRSSTHPAAQMAAPPLHGVEPGVALATGLDPACALSVRLRLPASGQARFTFATAASDQAGTLQAVIDKYRQASQVERASLMSTTLAGVRLRALQTRAEDLAAIQRLTTALVCGLTRVRHEAACLPPEHTGGCDRRLLWAHGISGDRPILLVTVGTPQGLGLLRVLTQALRLWSWCDIACDVVVLNMEPVSYEMALAHALATLQQRSLGDDHLPSRMTTSSLQVLRADDLGEDVLSTLRHLARVQLHADGRPLHHHVQAWADQHELARALRLRESGCAVPGPTAPVEAVPDPLPIAPPRTVPGRFLPGRGGYQFDVSAAQRPIRPWINVLSNPQFGTQVSETGAGCTWAVNSRLQQLTAWSNDPVADPPHEWFLLQDTRTRAVWHVAPSAWGDPLATYQVTHDAGSTVIRHRRDALEVTTTWCVDPQQRLLQVGLRLVNHGRRSLSLRLIGLVEWQMGASPADRLTVHTARHGELLTDEAAVHPGRPAAASPGTRLTALLATQLDHSAGFGGSTAFLGLIEPADPSDDRPEWTCDRREFFDASGRVTLPDHFGQRAGGGLDPCAALSTTLSLMPGAHAERFFLLGHADDAAAARRLAAEAAASTRVDGQRLVRSRAHWDDLLGAVTVATPDPLLDVLVNRWLLYQTVSCRMWAKAAFYQAGGATGFRDQLQDAMALAWAAPAMLREQILRCAARQFATGDVQHWWHAPSGAGVRTHFSDDLLWLPLACAHHLRATGDAALLDQRVPFLAGAAIPDGAEDVYDTPSPCQEVATVYEHAARSIDHSLAVGAHGLPLMGSGDWNDGMNRVGSGGQGESVWLGWFLCTVVAGFAPLARGRGEVERANRWEAAATGWRQALNTTAWDGAWFTRAYFDNGQPLGSQHNTQARIDLIAQAWSVLSQAGEPALQVAAMDSARQLLIDVPAGLVRLLDPPLTDAQPSAGYIQAYPPGVRENGGQYSHAGVWALMALAELARGGPASAQDAAGDEVYRVLSLLSPAHRSEHLVWGAAYGLEPYVMAGDICSQPPYVGRGGWSWYTGAAAWMHRAVIESLFGLQLQAHQLSLRPCLPSHWPRAELTLTREGRRLQLIVLRADAATALAATAMQGAHLLLPGQVLDWPHLDRHACFVLPLLEARAAQPA
jgi:cyclic beta-1,2-glucan synthetase